MLLKYILLLFSVSYLSALPLQPPQHFYFKSQKFDGHPGHFPFISDLTFRAISDFVIDQSTEWFEPENVRQGDIIYLNAWFLPWFEKYVHDQIKYPYILITCDVGSWFPDPAQISKLLYDPKCAAWFCKNILFSYHPKIFQIPMGQTIYYFENSETPALMRTLFEMSLQSPEKQHFLYMNHTPRKHGSRDQIVRLFEHAPYCFTRNYSDRAYVSLSQKEYYKDLAASRFTLSPFGLETDCVRTWEALVLNCTPIVEHTFVDALFDDLPVIFVHQWEEIDEEFLERKSRELKGLRCEKALFSYWHQLIKDVQKKIKSNDLTFTKLEATLFDSKDLEDLRILLQPFLGGPLICKGFLTSLRSLQLTEECFSQVFLYDPWLNYNSLSSLGDYTDDFLYFIKHSSRVNLLEQQEHGENGSISQHIKFETACISIDCPIFLDLTYHRSSLLRDFNNLRHSLQKDLVDLYEMCSYGTVICGNMVKNTYVKEVLERLTKEKGWSIQTKGNFWSVTAQ